MFGHLYYRGYPCHSIDNDRVGAHLVIVRVMGKIQPPLGMFTKNQLVQEFINNVASIAQRYCEGNLFCGGSMGVAVLLHYPQPITCPLSPQAPYTARNAPLVRPNM